MTQTTKKCSQCKTVQPLEDYHRNAASEDGHVAACRLCVAQRLEVYAATTEAERQAKQDRKLLPKVRIDFKKCRTCEQVRAVEEYHYSPNTRDRCVSYCKTCERKRYLERKAPFAAQRHAQQVTA